MLKIKKFIQNKKSRKIYIPAIFLIVGFLVFYKIFISQGSNYSWIQSDWSGGADTGATATHTTNQSGWTKFFSKDANVDVTATPGEITLTNPLEENVDTTDADFNEMTQTTALADSGDFYINGDSIQLKKQDGVSCTVAEECIGGVCSDNICDEPWGYIGICSGIEVNFTDISGTKLWKTSNTNCDTPQCGINGGQDGDNLVDPVANPSVDFSLYPAQNACKAIGGRLPTKPELACIYTNRASLGSFQSDYYWSSTENDTAYAWRQYFSNGDVDLYGKTGSYYVRCVRGQ